MLRKQEERVLPLGEENRTGSQGMWSIDRFAGIIVGAKVSLLRL